MTDKKKKVSKYDEVFKIDMPFEELAQKMVTGNKSDAPNGTPYNKEGKSEEFIPLEKDAKTTITAINRLDGKDLPASFRIDVYVQSIQQGQFDVYLQMSEAITRDEYSGGKSVFVIENPKNLACAIQICSPDGESFPVRVTFTSEE